MKKIFLSLMAMALPIISTAQTLKIMAKGTTGLSHVIIANRGEFVPLQFTKGCMVYDRPKIKPYTAVFIMGDSLSAPAVLEPGQTLQISISKKQGQWEIAYKGKNAAASRFLKQMEKLYAHGWEKVSVDEYDDEVTTVNKDFDFNGEMKRLATEYGTTLQAADKVDNDSLRRIYRHQADVSYLASRIACLSARDKIKGISSDGQLQVLIASIDPNDDTMQEMGLVNDLIATKVTGSLNDDNITPYALSYIRAVDDNVQNPRIRHALLNNIASVVFNADGKTYVLDDFWHAFKQAADTALVNYYQTVVDSKLATKSGAKCPDETFQDIHGQTHRLSEWFNKGKYLYIDLWATWCIPCVKEIPFVEKHVAHYKDNTKIQFISISLDSHHDAWKRKLDKDKPLWPQYISATKDEMDKLMKDWGITGIPRFIIVNPDGTIHDSNAFRPSDPDFYKLMDDILK